MIVMKDKAELLLEFALENNAVVEQRKFKNFDRHVILTTKGTVALRSIDKEDNAIGNCELLKFNGFNNKLSEIKKEFTAIRIKGMTL